MNDLIDRQAAIDALNEVSEHYTEKGREWHPHVNFMIDAIKELPSAQPTQTNPSNALESLDCVSRQAAIDAECDPEVKCRSCGHRVAERPLGEVYCNIMCKWVNEKDYCTMFEPGQGKMKKKEAQI